MVRRQGDRLVISKYSKIIKLFNKKHIVYHSLFGNPLILEKSSFEIYNDLLHYTTDPDGHALKHAINGLEYKQFVKTLKDNFLLVPQTLDERNILFKVRNNFKEDLLNKSNLNSLSLTISNDCNYSCPNCLPRLARKHLPSDTKSKMDFAEAKSIIDDFILATSKNRIKYKEFFFGGREPLTNASTFIKCVQYINSKYSNAYKIKYSLFTNGSLINKKLAVFLNKNKVYIASSLDGTRFYNDINRKSLTLNSTFDSALNGWKILRENGNPINALSCTISKNNSQTLNNKFLAFIVKLGIKNISVNVDYTSLDNKSVDIIIKGILMLQESARKKGIEIQGQWTYLYKNIFYNVFNSTNFSFCSPYRGYSISVAPGFIYSICGSSVGNKNNGVDDFINSPEYLDIILNRFAGVINNCKGCDIEGLCMGGCYPSFILGNKSAFCEFQNKMFIAQLNQMHGKRQ